MPWITVTLVPMGNWLQTTLMAHSLFSCLASGGGGNLALGWRPGRLSLGSRHWFAVARMPLLSPAVSGVSPALLVRSWYLAALKLLLSAFWPLSFGCLTQYSGWPFLPVALWAPRMSQSSNLYAMLLWRMKFSTSPSSSSSSVASEVTPRLFSHCV